MMKKHVVVQIAKNIEDINLEQEMALLVKDGMYMNLMNMIILLQVHIQIMVCMKTIAEILILLMVILFGATLLILKSDGNIVTLLLL